MERLGITRIGPFVSARKTPSVIAAAALCCGAGLSGCESLPFGTGAQEAGPQPSNTVVSDPPPPLPIPPKPPEVAAKLSAKKIDVGPETPAPIGKPPVTTLSESQIVGAQSMQVEDLIGVPERIVTNAPSQTWYYASGPCRFSVQFFKDLDSGQYRALKYDVAGGSLERCLAQFERLKSAAPIEAQSTIKTEPASTDATSG